MIRIGLLGLIALCVAGSALGQQESVAPSLLFAELPRQSMERTPLPCEQTDTTRLFDANGDGHLDLLFGGMAATTSPGPAPFLFLNDGHGRLSILQGALPLGPLGTSNFDTRAADLDGDGDLDLFYGADIGPGAISRLLINDGSGRFMDELPARFPTPYLLGGVGAVAISDIDGDGDPDLVANAAGGYALHIFVNDGSGHFTDEGLQRIRPSMPLASYASIAVGDVDGDGDPDLVAGRFIVLQQPDLFINDGTGHFDDASSRIPRRVMFPHTIALADLDVDGDLDILAPSTSVNNVPGIGGEIVFVNDGTGHFTDHSTDFFPQLQNGIVFHHAIADLDGDGDPDVILPDGGGGITPLCRTRYYVNLTRQVYAPAPPIAGSPWRIEIYGPKLGFGVLALATREAHLPLGPLGTFGLDPAVTVTWPGLIPIGNRRVGTVDVPVPAGLPTGAAIYLQALVADPANLNTAHLTNVWDDAVR